MATAEIEAEYAQEAKEFAAELLENGKIAGFGISDGDDPRKRAYGYKKIEEAAVFGIEWRADFSNDVMSTDQMYLVSHKFDPRYDRMQFEGGPVLQVIHVKENFQPDGFTTIFYEIQVRV